MSSRDVETLTKNSVDVYELLQVPQDSTAPVIRKAYRKQTLIYHPDKNPSEEAAQVFHYLTLALTVLSDKQLRKEYDTWINSRKLAKIRTEKLDDDRRRMKVELEEAEQKSFQKPSTWNKRKANESTNSYGLEIERLREEGARKRREFEIKYLAKVNHDTSKQVESTSSSNIVKVRWKIKEGIAEFFSKDVLQGILSVFGDVEKIDILTRSSNEKRFDYAVVQFKNDISATKAVLHDFSKKSNLWDGTSYRKLSGLLREIKWLNNNSSNVTLNKENLGFEEYKDLTLTRLRSFKPLKV